MKNTPSVNPTSARRPPAKDPGLGEPVPNPKARSRRSPALPRAAEPVALLEEHVRSDQGFPVTIAIDQPDAREVFLAGSFNDWQPRANPMTKQRDGRWALTLPLRPGTHEYRVIVDGQWREDPGAGRFVANPFGGRNSVLEVGRLQA